MRPDRLLLFQGSDVSDEVLDLFGFQALAIPRHLGFAVSDDPGEFFIGLLLNIGGSQVPDLVDLADGRLALAVRSVAHGTLCLISGFSCVVGAGGRTPRRDSNNDYT